MLTIFTFLLSFLVAYLSLPILRFLAFRFQILDFPGERKIHKIATPLLGGVALYLGLWAGLLINLRYLRIFSPLLIGATFIFLLGLFNDVQEISASLRFFCQIIIALFVIFLGMRISFLPAGLVGDTLEVLLTVIWMVGLTNAYNYLDGLDGLAAGSAVINLLCFGMILYINGQYPLGLFAIILMAVCLAFLPYNFKKKIFLGESGSTLLGFTLAGIGVLGNWAKDNIVRISIPILILGVPIFDMIFTTLIRIREGKVKTILEWLKYGGKDHFHHYLVDLGFKPKGAVVFIYFITFSLGLSAIMLSNDIAVEAFLTLTQAGIIFGIIAALIVIGRRRHSGWS